MTSLGTIHPYKEQTVESGEVIKIVVATDVVGTTPSAINL